MFWPGEGWCDAMPTTCLVCSLRVNVRSHMYVIHILQFCQICIALPNSRCMANTTVNTWYIFYSVSHSPQAANMTQTMGVYEQAPLLYFRPAQMQDLARITALEVGNDEPVSPPRKQTIFLQLTTGSWISFR